MNVTQQLQKLAEYQAVTCFTKSHIKPDNLEERIEDGLGIAISQWSEWDGLKIMRVFFWALEDANFHEDAASVLDMLKKYSSR